MSSDNATANMSDNSTYPDPYQEINLAIDQYVTLVIFLIGFPGNVICFLIWIQKRMRHSSGCYLAALALADFVFLLLLVFLELHIAWNINTLNYPVVCSVFPVLHLVAQYLSPLLVLAFTTERYISICHPFKREKFCTIRRAKIVIACLVVFTFALNAVQGYFYHRAEVVDANGTVTEYTCGTRDEVMTGATKSVYQIYTTCVDMLCFLVGMAAVLVLNILVILEMRRLSRVEANQLHGSSQRTSATTVMLLCVSFYQIFTTMPISIAYALYMEFDVEPNAPSMGMERATHRYYVYNHVLHVIKEYGITHYAFNIFIYLITGKMFRQELKRLFMRPFGGMRSSYPSDYASLRNTTVRASMAGKNSTTTWVSVNGNQEKKEKEPIANETLL